MNPLDRFLADLADAAARADLAERDFRAETEARAARLASARAEAFRRANFMRAVTSAVAGAEEAADAAARALAHLRARFDWAELTPAREEVLARFATVAAALQRCEAGAPADAPQPPTDEDAPSPEAALAAFEDWYMQTRQSSFWHLFDHYMPETPRVDF